MVGRRTGVMCSGLWRRILASEGRVMRFAAHSFGYNPNPPPPPPPPPSASYRGDEEPHLDLRCIPTPAGESAQSHARSLVKERADRFAGTSCLLDGACRMRGVISAQRCQKWEITSCTEENLEDSGETTEYAKVAQ